MFYKDTPGKMDAVNPVANDDDANMGLKARYAFTKQSQTVDMIGRIHSDIFFQDRLILNGVNLRLKLKRAKSSFCLVSSASGANHKVVITEAIRYIRKVKVAPSIALGHAAALKQATAKYPIYLYAGSIAKFSLSQTASVALPQITFSSVISQSA